MPTLLLTLALAVAGPRAGITGPRADANHDAIPDGVGQVVTVSGRASVASGRLGGPGAFFVQDAWGGVRIDHPDGPPVARGDSVVVTGRLAFREGVVVLDRPRVRVVAGPLRVPAPVPYDAANPESVEGRLVTVEGTVTGFNPVSAGNALHLSLPGGSGLVAFVYVDRDEDIPTNAYAPGDRVRVTGIAGQYDRDAPFREAYQVYPRTPDDVVRLSMPPGAYRTGSGIALGLLALAILWVWTLRRQVARRVAELARSEERYRRLVERASDAVVVHDLAGEEGELNAAARLAFGLGAGADVPPLHLIVHPGDRETLRAHLAFVAGAGHARTDLRVARPDGTAGVYEVESQALALDGRTRVLSLARDVGARRAHENGLDHARRAAEEALRVKSAFLASMSHEIRTPLTAVIGYAELLRDEVADEQQDLVAAIESGGHRLLATLNSVLDLARLEAGRETLRPAAVDLVAHVRDGLRLFDGMAAKKGLTLVFAPATATAALPAVLDAGALDRILINLVGNALKFTDTGYVTVSLAACGADVALAVADTGVGMSDEFLPAVFDEFRQASEGDARSHEGSGLGLAITRQLVALMGGTVCVESAPGVGTTFTVRLPLGEAEAVPA